MKPLQTGQHWDVKGKQIEITAIGKLLVNYRLTKHCGMRRPFNFVESKADLEKYLKDQKAIVVKA